MNPSQNFKKPVPLPKPAAEAQRNARALQNENAAGQAAKWGRVDEEHNVWLKTADGERIVGQYAAGGTDADALKLYVRRYLDLKAQIDLLEARVEHISPEEARKSLKTLQDELTEPAVVGDVDALRNRAQELTAAIEKRAQTVSGERAAAKEKALQERTALVEHAEEIANRDPEKTHWRDSREEFEKIFEQWKYAQRHGARIDRATEDGLWKRFSAARTKFDRHRRQHFSELEAQRRATVAQKEDIIARAVDLQTSTDWTATTAVYRRLLEEWKKAGRSGRKDDDRLWERFRAAQQVFFDARTAYNAQIDEEYAGNLTQKLELLAEAEKLLPINDVAYAKEQIRAIGDKWDRIGRVPRADIARTEGRMREIEAAIRDAENEQWASTDPEKDERASGMAAQLEELIADLQARIETAKEKGETAKIKEFEEALEARKAWLKAVTEG